MVFKESETIELKTSTSELKEAIISIVAILNKHQKGELYFGIKDNGAVIGQDIGKQTIRDISKAISDNIEPKIYPRINSVEINGKKCIKVQFNGNELIAEMFHRIHFIEKWGRGISLILSKEPGTKFKEIGTHFTVLFKRKHHKKEATRNKSAVGKTVEKTVEKILSLIAKNQYITVKKLVKKTGLTRRGIEWNIEKMKNEKIIKRVGPDRGGHWEIAKRQKQESL